MTSYSPGLVFLLVLVTPPLIKINLSEKITVVDVCDDTLENDDVDTSDGFQD